MKMTKVANREDSTHMYNVFQRKTRDYIFDDKLNKKRSIVIIFGTLITQTIGYRKVVSFSHLTYVTASPLPWKSQNAKIHKFSRK